MDERSRFEVAADVVAADFEGTESVVLNLATKKYYTLNETATAIWAGIEERREAGALIELLTAQFEVSRDRAASSVFTTLSRLQAQDLVRACPEAERHHAESEKEVPE